MIRQRLSVRALWGLAGWALPLIAVFLLTPRLLAVAGPSRFGVLMICFVTPLMAAQFDFGIAASATRRFAAALRVGRIPLSALTTFGLPQLLIAAVLGGGLIALAPWISGVIGFDEVLGSSSGGDLVRLCGIWVAAAIGLSMPLTVARSAQLISWTSFIQTVTTLVLWVGAVYAVHAELPLHNVVELGIALQIVAALLTAINVRDRIEWSRPFLPRSPVRYADFRFSLGMFASQLAGIVVYQGDRILVSAVGSPAMAGSYALCTNLANKLLGAVAALTSFVFPHASGIHDQYGMEPVEELLHALDRAIVVLTVPLLILMLVLAEPFFALWLKGLGEPDIAMAFRLLAIGFTTTALIVPVSQVLAASGETLLGAKFSWLTAVVASICILLLVPAWGIVGAAAGMLLAMSTSMLFGYVARRRLRIRPAPNAAAMRRGLLLGAFIEVAVLLVAWPLVWSWFGLLAVSATAWLAFYISRAAFGLLSPEELRLLRRGMARASAGGAARAAQLAVRPPTISMRSIAAADHAADDAETRIRSYEYSTTMAEIAHLEALASRRGPEPATQLRSLQGRPHALRLVESRMGYIALGLTQRLAEALAPVVHRVKRIDRRTLAGVPAPPASAPAHPPLIDGHFNPMILRQRPTLLLDVTPTFRQPQAGGGIPRSVRALARVGIETGLALPVVIKNGRLYSYYAHAELEGPLDLRPDDVYAVIDVYWYHLEDYANIIESARSAGARVAMLLYDILPLRHPSLYPVEVPRTFELGLRRFLAASDYCVSISKSTQEDIADYLREIDFPQRAHLALRYFHLGLHPGMETSGDVRARIASVFDSGATFLAVGTIEPRKGYSVALDACDLAWTRGEDFRFVIIGRYGWRSLAIRDRILGHPEFNRRLFWFSDANDGELAHAYARCIALLQCSVAEGFGLPLLEAARMGAPVIASDLPVFKEIGQSKLTYFEVGDAASLAAAMLHYLAARPSGVRLEWSTWTDALRAFATCVDSAADTADRHRAGASPRAVGVRP